MLRGLREVSVALLVMAVCVASLGRDGFNDPGVIVTAPPSNLYPFDASKSFRGGYDEPQIPPGRARPPQPDYNNWVYGGVNFYEHELVYLEGNLLLDWQPRTGNYRIFELVRNPQDECPVIPEAPIASGTWQNRTNHKLLYIGCGGMAPGGKLLDFHPSDGTYRLYRFDHRVQGTTDPIMELLASGFRREVMNFSPLYLNDDEIFFYEKNTGAFSIYYINNQLPSAIDPLQPPEPIVFGKLSNLHQQQVYLGSNQILDYDPLFGRYWIYTYDRTATNHSDPFVGPIASGLIERNMVLSYLADEQLVMMDPDTGLFGVFNMSRPTPRDAYLESQKSADEIELENYNIFTLNGPQYSIKALPGNFGFGSIVEPNQCSGANTCRTCLRRPGCGWCSTSSQCLRGATVEPCAQNCTTWMPMFCEAEPCSSHSSCSECLSDPFCGWCGQSASCTEGTTTGPLFGACGGWSKSVCPVYSEGPDGLPPQPCVTGGLIVG